MTAHATQRHCALIAVFLALSLVGCGEPAPSEQSANPAATQDPGTCPVTLPNGENPPGETPQVSHHGDGELFTVLDPLGVILVGPDEQQPNGSYSYISTWWRAEDVEGPLNVNAVRLDAEAPPPRIDIPNRDEDFRGFQRAEVFFPSEGCWRITVRVAGSRLDVVQLVVDPRDP